MSCHDEKAGSLEWWGFFSFYFYSLQHDFFFLRQKEKQEVWAPSFWKENIHTQTSLSSVGDSNSSRSKYLVSNNTWPLIESFRVMDWRSNTAGEVMGKTSTGPCCVKHRKRLWSSSLWSQFLMGPEQAVARRKKFCNVSRYPNLGQAAHTRRTSVLEFGLSAELLACWGILLTSLKLTFILCVGGG